MERPSKTAGRGSRWPIWLLGGAAVLVVGLYFHMSRAGDRPTETDHLAAHPAVTPTPATQPATEPNGDSATQPATQPATEPKAQPATQPAAKPAPPQWVRPRFTARRSDRDRMVRVIRSAPYALTDAKVLAAMTEVPRHEFVPERSRKRAYGDHPLPIGYGQTISQPYIVAEMTHQLALKPTSRVLEIGTGSGYQAAVLSELTPHVYTIEIVKPLAQSARKRLKQLGYNTVQVAEADGYHGWPDRAPFDAIIVTCAAGQIPPPLIRQLAKGGRMVIPVGGRYATQSLMLVTKDAKGKVRSRSLMAVRFVPLLRGPSAGEP